MHSVDVIHYKFRLFKSPNVVDVANVTTHFNLEYYTRSVLLFIEHQIYCNFMFLTKTETYVESENVDSVTMIN